MPFGNKALPTIVYSYGCKVAAKSLGLVHDQLRAAHRYRNKLVELERDRRAKVDAMVAQLSPDLAPVESELADIERQIEETYEQIRKASQQTRSRVKPTAEQKAQLSHAKTRRRELSARRKDLRKACFDSLEFKAEQKAIDDDDLASRKTARASSGVSWGTYLQVERSMSGCRSGAPPRFARYRSGQVAVQIQHGLTVDQIAEGDNRLAIVDTDKRYLRDVRMRLSVEHGSIEVRAKFHRPLPEDAKVQWVALVHKRIATRDKWSLQFTLARQWGWQNPVASSGYVAVNIGWRTMADGIRAATWIGDDGDSGTLLLDPLHVGRVSEVESLQSIRDKNLDTIKLQLRSWLTTTKDLPDWLVEETQTVASWKNQGRLAALVLRWEKERFSGDDDMFRESLAWWKQDRHLYEWQENSRLAFYDWRKNAYRVFAADLARKYHKVLLAKVSWKQMQDKPPAEEEDDMRLARQRKRLVAPYDLQDTLIQRFADHELIESKNLSARCHTCRELSGEVEPASLYHTCRKCVVTYDQDRNHCENLLANLERTAALADV